MYTPDPVFSSFSKEGDTYEKNTISSLPYFSPL